MNGSLAVAALLLLVAATLAGCAGDASPDSDGDGVPDAKELAGWDITFTLVDGTVVHRHVTSDPHNQTTDGSHLLDTYKYALGLDPHQQDTDGDGLTDCQEVYDTSLAHCQLGYAGPIDQGYRTRADQADSDHDGAADGLEVHGWDVVLNGTSRHVTSNPLLADTDGDGLVDGQEASFRVDPRSPDTDHDGCPDGTDVYPEVDARFGPGLGDLTWHGAQPADLRLLVGVGGLPVAWPAQADPPLHVLPGQTLHLASQGQPLLAATCSFAPARPWLNLQVQVTWEDAPGGARPVDIASKSTGGPLPATLYYDPRSGEWSTALNGTQPMLLPVHFEGSEASLAVAPVPLDAAGRFLQGE